ncbi:MAG: hypothetical protein JOZ29_07130 [Deltaproteobacteria bacterium]|nr:hypothetical protein [Deltaproteobacteria bacterium]
MRYELIAILVTAGFQSSLLIAAIVMLYRMSRALDATIRPYGSGNLWTTIRAEENIKRVEEYVRQNADKIDAFIRDFQRQQ